MKHLLSIFIVALLGCKLAPEPMISPESSNIVGKWRLVSFDIPNANDGGGTEVKLSATEPFELMTITDQNQFEFRTMGGTMSKKDNYGTVQMDKTKKNIVFVSEKYVGNSLSYIIVKLTTTDLELKQQTRAGLLGRRYVRVVD
jgi:hypothetical protein